MVQYPKNYLSKEKLEWLLKAEDLLWDSKKVGIGKDGRYVILLETPENIKKYAVESEEVLRPVDSRGLPSEEILQ